jgi:maltose/moltooligosaccharide transporter
LLSALALLILPNAPVLWVAVVAFWMLDVSVNVAMEPFRAFVGDMLPSSQRAFGYAVQSILIGAGALAASALPYLMSHQWGVTSTAPLGQIPDSVTYSFYIGAVALVCAIAWTVFTTAEYSPTQLAHYENKPLTHPTHGIKAVMGEFLHDLTHLSPTMKRLAWVQFFTWSGFFVMWIYTTPIVAMHQFHATAAGTEQYNQAGDWVGILFAVYNAVAFAYGFCIGPLAKYLGANRLHALNLLMGALGFVGLVYIPDPNWLIASMIGIGIAWSSVLTLPYTLLCEVVPYEKFGTYMGIFNLFIVLPQIMTSVLLGKLVHWLWPNDPVNILWMAAVFFSFAALAVWRRFE